MPQKPESKQDLLPPFERIGDAGWDDEIKSFLNSYDVPLATPSKESAIQKCETRLNTQLPQSYREFLAIIGPQIFGYLKIFGPDDIRQPNEWFSETLEEPDKQQLKRLLRVGDAGGSGNVFAIDTIDGSIHLISHDPLGIHRTHKSFDDLIREYCIGIFAGYYGWPDAEIEEMVEDLRLEMFPRAA